MNTEIIAHPRLLHYGLITANLDAMIDWYRKVLGMTINNRSEVPARAQGGPPFSAFAFVSNDERDHRVVFFEMPGASPDPDKRRHTGLQHVAFEYATLDDLLGTYLRLKGIGILPLWSADHGLAMSFYYEDPDKNVVELTINTYGDAWTATEYLKTSSSLPSPVDPDKMIALREAGTSPWELHKRALAGELAPAKQFDPRTRA